MFNYELLINLFLITWFFTNHDRITFFLDKSYLWLSKKSKNKIILFILSNLHEVLTCHKCFSFWTTLFVTQNLIEAILVSFVASILQKKEII